MKYSESEISSEILKSLDEMGFVDMTPIQEQAIPVMMKGRDIVGQAQTGTGKTAAFGIPMIDAINPMDDGVQGLVLCPTRELAMQGASELKKMSRYVKGIKIVAIYGGQDISRQFRELKGNVSIVIGTPGRVMDHMRRGTLKFDNLKILVLDEADEMLDMLLGFVAYGLSIFMYIRAQSVIGAAKTSAYYAFAPFIAALLSFVFLHARFDVRRD